MYVFYKCVTGGVTEYGPDKLYSRLALHRAPRTLNQIIGWILLLAGVGFYK